MNVDSEMKTAIETVAKAKVAEALGGDVLGRIVQEVLDHKPRGYGGSRDERTTLDRIVIEVVEQQITKAVREVVAENADVQTKIRDAVRARADAFTATIVDAFAKDDWRADLTVKIES
ncbi:hypothetical protein [Marinibacterium sp. SX1]|uniref:hypothetical protein n=1 Tax=Marinibacterium sp. SX1 TaxID=3388424 RepID=UPI003D17C7A2